MIFRSSIADQIDDFRISITGSGDQVTLQAGDTREPFVIPFERDQVERALGDYSPSRISTDPLTSFGSTLFSSLFSGKVGRQMWEQLADAEAGNRSVRLRIVTNLERLQHLPWELLFDPSRGDFISLSGRLALVRTRQDGVPDEPLPPLSQLRILAAEADVQGDMDTHMDLQILRKFAGANPSVVELDVLEHATPEALRNKLANNSYDIFHFAGTGEVLPNVSKRGGIRQALRLWGSASIDPLFNRHELGVLLGKAGVRLAVLNADHSDWIARSLARYIPSAIGFRESIWTEGCLVLCETLYPLLVAPTPLDLAVTAVRQAVNQRLPGTGQWCKIIFYLQTANGLLLLGSKSADGGSASIPKPEKRDKALAKLSGLLNVYERNLSAAVQSGSETVADLRQKVDELKRLIGDSL
jgi:CHAT domain